MCTCIYTCIRIPTGSPRSPAIVSTVATAMPEVLGRRRLQSIYYAILYCIIVYIYIEREREIKVYMYLSTYVYIYIYI